MKLNIKHHLATDTISVTWAHRESDKCSAWCSSHNTGWDMPPEQWLEVIGEVRRKIAYVQLLNEPDQPADLAAKIAEHGGAT